MSSYIIAGSANRPETGECEQIADIIKSYYKNIDFRIIIKHPDEWDNYIHEILRIYGFKKLYDPIVFTLDGKLIGGINGFKELAQKGFGIENIDEVQNNITPEINMKIVEKEVTAKKKIQKGKKTIEEKISLKLKEHLNNGTITAIEGYYKSYINNGLMFYIKEDQKLCPYVYIPKTQYCEVVKDKIQEGIFSIRLNKNNDREVLHIYKIYIEKLDLQGIAVRDYFTQENTQPDEEHNNSTLNKSKIGDKKLENLGTMDEINKKDLVEEQKEDQGEDKSKEQSQAQIGSLENDQQQSVAQIAEETGAEADQQDQAVDQQGSAQHVSNQQLQEEIAEKQQQEESLQNKLLQNEEDLLEQCNENNFCEQIDLRPTLIKQIKDDYYLAFHPNALLDGQIILFEKSLNEQNKNQDENQEEEDDEHQIDERILIQDWSRKLKHRTVKKQSKQMRQIEEQLRQQQQQNMLLIENQGQGNAEQEDKQQQAEQEQEENKHKYQSKFNRDTVQLDKPLSKQDWAKVIKIIKKLECLVSFQILPFGQENHRPLSNNVLNIYLREFLTRAYKNQGLIEILEDYNKNEQEIEVQLLPFEKYILDLKGQPGRLNIIKENYIQIPNLEFDHLIYITKTGKQEPSALKQKFQEMIRYFYSEQDLMQYGINCIMSREFIMIVPLRGPYGTFEDKPLYLNPIAYLGYIHVPIMTKIWPTTAYPRETLTDKKDYIKLLNNSIENVMKL